MSLRAKSAVVTGSTSGIGLAIARAYAKEGANILINGFGDAAEIEATRAAIEAEFGVRALYSGADMSKGEEIEGMIREAEGAFGSVDILVNNAGIQLRKPMVDLAVDEWRRVLETNLTSAFVVGREAARRMIARGEGGKIINIGSLTSEVARATVAPYTAAKGGIKQLTRSMAAEWAAHGIQANAIGPGYIITDMNKALVEDAKFDAWVRGRTPSGRWGVPDDLIGVTVFLASAASAYVNGQIIYVDGGMLAVL
jgi:gluconate 5-dehydrogenase